MAKSLQELIDESIKNSEKTEEIVPEKETVTEEKEVEKKPKKVGTIIKANIGRGFRNIEEATKFSRSPIPIIKGELFFATKILFGSLL